MSASPFYQVESFNTFGLGRQALLQRRAHFMRFHPTPSEALLWRHLRGRQLGVQFRRQVVLGTFIVDFCAPTSALIIEVDGGLITPPASAPTAAGMRSSSGRDTPSCASPFQRWRRM